MEDKSLSNQQFQAGDISRILGIDRNRLFYWINTHRLLKPDREEADGTGTRAKFSMENLLELAMIKELDDNGMDLKKIRVFKNSLKNQYYRKYKEDFYCYVLECPEYLREFLQLKIRQKNNKFSIDFNHHDYEADGEGGAVPAPGEFEPLETPARISEKMFYSQLLEIGNLANQLIENVKKG